MESQEICLLVRGFFPPDEGGIPFFYRDLTKVLSKNHEVTVLSRNEPENSEIPEKVQIISHSGSGKFQGALYEIKAIYNFIKRNYDVVISPFQQIQVFPSYWYLSHLHSTPHLVVLHGTMWRDLYRPRLKSGNIFQRGFAQYNDWAWKEILDGVTGVVSLGLDMFDMVKDYGVTQKKMFEANILVDMERFNPSIDPISKFNVDENILMFCGRLDSDKGVKDLLQTLPTVIEYDEKVHLVIVGKGKQESKLKRTVSKMSLEEKVTFAGWVSHKQLPSYLASADIIVNPGRWGGGIGNVTIESMAMGKPVVIGKTNKHVKKVFDDLNCGLTFEPGNRDKLSQKIIKLLSDENLRKKLSERAIEYTREHFSIQKNVEVWNKILKEVMF